jgi:excisionase family DNA binding protein
VVKSEHAFLGTNILIGGDIMNEFTVKEVAELLEKHEETIKRWIRAGKLPNSYRNSDKEGWRIIESDLLNMNQNSLSNVEQEPAIEQKETKIAQEQDEENEQELVKLAYEAVTLTSPTEQMVNILSYVGIKRTLEILLIMQQSPNKVKNPEGFIRKAISKGWTPTSLPQKIDKRLAEFENRKKRTEQVQQEVPSFNWLENNVQR